MSDPTGYPVGVAIDQSGNTYVTNIYDFNGGGEVREYSPRSKLGVQLGNPNLAEDYFVAVDAIGDIFVDGITHFSCRGGLAPGALARLAKHICRRQNPRRTGS